MHVRSWKIINGKIELADYRLCLIFRELAWLVDHNTLDLKLYQAAVKQMQNLLVEEGLTVGPHHADGEHKRGLM